MRLKTIKNKRSTVQFDKRLFRFYKGNKSEWPAIYEVGGSLGSAIFYQSSGRITSDNIPDELIQATSIYIKSSWTVPWKKYIQECFPNDIK